MNSERNNLVEQDNGAIGHNTIHWYYQDHQQ